jgi:hypothetical protein
MTCAEFQKVLPYIIETGGSPAEEAHLQTCPICADLVADLRYIAEQAKLLVPMEEPAPRVWTGIQKALEHEGLVRPAGARRGLLGFTNWGPKPWLAGALAMVLIALGILMYRQASSRPNENPEIAAVAAPEAAPPVSAEDRQMLEEVAARTPALKATYEENLQRVNAYISDAKRSVEQNPDDEDARQSLIRAYQQKALLYDMALSRSLQ